MTRTILARIFLVPLLALALASPAFAGSIGQVPVVGSVGSMVNGASINTPGGLGSFGAPSIGLASGGVNSQVTINGSRNITSNTDVTVNKTFNGTDLGYGLGGADVLNVISNAGSMASDMRDQRADDQQQALYQALESQALYYTQMLNMQEQQPGQNDWLGE